MANSPTWFQTTLCITFSYPNKCSWETSMNTAFSSNKCLGRFTCQAYLIYVYIIRSTLKATVILLPLLGLTWVFGVLAIDSNTSVFAWLFTICNSSQVCNAPKLMVMHILGLSFCCALYKLLQNSIHFTYASSSVWFILHAKSLHKYYHCRVF